MARTPLQLGGMALRNGVLVVGPRHWAASIRAEDGTVTTTCRERPQPAPGLVDRIPFVRGPLRMAGMFLTLPRVRREQPAARFAFEAPSSLVAMVLAGAATRVLRSAMPGAARGELAGGALSLAVTVAALRTGEVAAYHGAEHKAIGGYELGIDAAQAPRRHPRCGTNLALPMLASTAVASTVLARLFPGRPAATRLGGQVVGVAIATELFRAGQRPGTASRAARVATRVGAVVQTVTTAEPTPSQLDVGRSAVAAVLAAEAAAGVDEPTVDDPDAPLATLE